MSLTDSLRFAGCLKALTGLSASVYAIIYGVTLAPDALNFILFIALLMPCAGLLSFPFINAVPFRQPGEWPMEGKFWSNRESSPTLSFMQGRHLWVSTRCMQDHAFPSSGKVR